MSTAVTQNHRPNHRPIRTRIAPSPTGFLHLGTARTALFNWAFARKHGGQFVLRIEDTDVARSTQEAVDGIIAAMAWLGMDYDEGPYFQMQRIDRYKQVIAQMLTDGTAYHCYTSQTELQAMRDAQQARGERMRYDGTWRPEPGKTLPPVPASALPVVRFKNPSTGHVQWDDLVKGSISISNEEMDDLIIARSDGTPTYNFCVVVDDLDMQITHVIRGDDHVNNTPRQINILRALNAPLPQYAHVPMINGPDGQKLSKRHGAVSVMQYQEQGFLPDGMINYLARLGWSHGDDELFTRAQLIEWFDIEHLARSSAQWDPKKLAWVNNHHIKHTSDEQLAHWVAPLLHAQGLQTEHPPLAATVALLKDRAENLQQLAQSAQLFYATPLVTEELKAHHNVAAALPAIAALVNEFESLEWNAANINAAIKACIGQFGLKMPQIAVPLRVLVTGQAQTPSVDQVLALFGKATVLQRLKAHLSP